MQPIQVVWNRGIYLPEADLWLDPMRRAERAFISHAHSDHVARHRWTLCSPLTQHLLQKRYAMGKDAAFLTPALHESAAWEGWELKLLPAGHIPGSTMLHLTRTADGATLLYTGDYKLRHGLSCEPCQLARADVLIMESTFGLPRFRFPPLETTRLQVLEFVRETLAAGGIPVLLGYSLGKAQEILRLLHDCGHPVMLHKAVHEMTEATAAAMGPLPDYKLFDASLAPGHVVIYPPNCVRALTTPPNPGYRTAILTGWAINPSAKYQYRTDAAFPLSDHADYDELHETAAAVQPQQIWIVHGYTRELAASLRQRGYNAWALQGGDQLELALDLPPD